MQDVLSPNTFMIMCQRKYNRRHSRALRNTYIILRGSNGHIGVNQRQVVVCVQDGSEIPFVVVAS